MNKCTLVDRVAAKTGLDREVAAEAVDAVLSILANTLENGEPVKLMGFGCFRVTERKASKGRNPRTGEEIHIEPVRNIRFRQGVELRKKINGRTACSA